MGVLRPLQPQPPEPRYRLQQLGQARQGTFYNMTIFITKEKESRDPFK